MSSISRAGTSEPFELQISRGQIPNHSAFYKYGSNAGVGTSYEVVWSNGGTLGYLGAASVLKVSSDSANDTSAGTGARTVTVVGLDANYAEVIETVTLNGLTSVNTTTSFLRMYRAYLATVGSGGTNAGAIYVGTGTVTSGVPATIYTEIEIGVGQTLQAFYTVPAGYSLYVTDIDYTSANSATNSALFEFRTRASGGAWLVKHTSTVIDSTDHHEWKCPFKVPEKTDIEVRAKASGTTIDTSANIMGILIKE